MERLNLMVEQEIVTAIHLVPFLQKRPDALDDPDLLIGVLRANRGHVTRTAEVLGVSRATLYRRLAEHDIVPSLLRERVSHETVLSVS